MLVHELVERTATVAPWRVALHADGARTTYDALWRRALEIVAALTAAGVGRGERTILAMRKSADAVAAILGTMAAGAVYIPLDPSLPPERAQTIAEDAGAAAILAAPEDQARAEALATASGAAVLLLPPGAPPILARSVEPCARAAGEGAAILFTSGSTNRPKGVCIGHRQIVHFADWAAGQFDLLPSDRLLSHAPLAFDLSFLDLFAAFAAGASVVLAPAQLAGSGAALLDLCRKTRVTVWQSVPSALRLLADAAKEAGAALPDVRHVLFAGEPMPIPLLDELRGVFPRARRFNIYGCTETNDTFIHEVPAAGAVPDPLPIGRPLPGVRWRLLDEDGREVPLGEPGELMVAAPTMMDGYLDPAQTLAATVELDGMRYYRSRDLVRALPSGELVFLGRTDWTVKTHGYRVNLLEVEDWLAAFAGVAETAVVPLPDQDRGHLLVAVLRFAGKHRPLPSTLEFKRHCARRLPPYAIPARFLAADGPMPRNANGKIDRRALARSLQISHPTS